jgi:predicted kinase
MEAVLLCGAPSSGKSTFYLSRFSDSHVRINRDLLRTTPRETRFLDVCVENRQAFCVDQVNATPDVRAPYIRAGREGGFKVIAYVLEAPVVEMMARNAGRPERVQVPNETILSTVEEFVMPTHEEGFDEVWRAWADGRGDFHVERLDGAPEARFTKRARASS